jgi:hypothetical protein
MVVMRQASNREKGQIGKEEIPPCPSPKAMEICKENQNERFFMVSERKNT